LQSPDPGVRETPDRVLGLEAHVSKEKHEKNGLVWYSWRDQKGVLQIELTGEGFLTEPESDTLAGEFLNESHYELLVQEDCDVLLPAEPNAFELFAGQESREDRLLLSFRKNVFPESATQAARESLRNAAGSTKNRGTAAGKVEPEKIGRPAERLVLTKSGRGARYISHDGILSDTVEANHVNSGIVGNFGSTARNPYCRQTSFTRDFPEKMEKAIPFVELVSQEFRRLLPERWSAQDKFVEQAGIREKQWSLGNTAFTTITVNKNFQTAAHKDAGDLETGFGNLTVLEKPGSSYDGGFTVFPRYRVAADVREGDFIAMDVHQWHGNTKMIPRNPEEEWERVSLVCYCRVDLKKCGTKQEEREKYEKWRGGSIVNSLEKHEFRVQEIEKRSKEEHQNLEEFMGMFGAD